MHAADGPQPTKLSNIKLTSLFFRGSLGAEGNTVRLSTAPMQPVAADDVAAMLADVALASPANGVIELAGPEKLSIADFVGRFLTAKCDQRQGVGDPQAL